MTQQNHTLPDASRRRRPWVVAVPLAIFVLIALAWSGFWFFALSKTEKALADWQAREASFGRTFRCGQQSIGGFPFRFELRCVDPRARFDSSAQPVALAAKDFVTVAQIWQPTLLISELVGPLTIGEPDKAPVQSVSWSLAQASMRGMPNEPEHADVVIDQLMVASLDRGAQRMLANAGRLELHGRIASGSARDNPVLDLALNLSQASASQLGELAARPFDADIVGVLRGLKNLTPKSGPETLRALQAANGRLDITKAQVKQGDVLAVGTGSLSLTPRGALNGELKVTVTNFEKLIPLLGIDRMVAQVVPQGTIERLAPGLDKLVPGLGGVLRGSTSGPAAKGVIDAFGARTELDGQSAVTVPLRFSDGAVLLGPFRLTEIPPLY